MGKDKTIRSSLLLSQEEIALLLGIKRSVWSMYEGGLRDLPTAAVLKLASLTIHANNLSKIPKKELPYQKKQEAAKQKMLLKQIENNRFEQFQLERKLNEMERKYNKAVNTIQFVRVLKEKEEIMDQQALVLQTVEKKALAILDKNGVHLQTKYLLQLNALLAHTKVLEKELQKG